MWKIVEFHLPITSGGNLAADGGHVGSRPTSVVPKTWLFENNGRSLCWWPPKNSANVTNLIRKMAPPQHGWEIYHVARIYRETLYDYTLARDVLNNGSEVTDLEELIRAIKSKEYGRGKRSPKRKCLGDGDEEGVKAGGLRSVLSQLPVFSSDEEELDHVHRLNAPEVPKKMKMLENRQQCDNLHAARRTPSPHSQRGYSGSSTLREERTERESQQLLHNSESQMTQPGMTLLMSKIDGIYKMIEGINANISHLSCKVVALEKTQHANLDRINEAFHHMRESNTNAKHSSQRLPFQLPIQNWLEFCGVMEKIKDEDVKEQLVKILSQTGGKNITSVCNSILRKILSNNLANICSWMGQRGNKKALNGSQLLAIVHSAVVRHSGMELTTEEVVKEKIQNWLQQASRRLVKGIREEDEKDEIIYELFI